MNHDPVEPSKSRRRRWRGRGPRGWRGLIFRLAAVALALAPFVVLELILTALDWGRPSYDPDPFLGFRGASPLFVLSEDGERYEIAKGRQTFFYPDAFPATRREEEYRVFCLGGSTVQGRPFSIETSFSTWLELGLQAADPRRPSEVVNCGGISYASYRLVPILQEILRYSPDLVVIYSGQNEFLEDRTYEQIKQMPEILAAPLELCSRLRTFVLLHAAYVSLTGSPEEVPAERPLLPAEVDALLDHRGGLATYHRDAKWRRDVIQHYTYNLGRMVQLCRSAGVPVILVNPVANLRDCPPFKSEHREDLTGRERERWTSLRAEARRHYRTAPRRAVDILREAARLDELHAGTHYELAKCLDLLGRTDEAREAYRRAKELDVCPLRILEPMHRAVMDVAASTGAPLVDARALFEDLSDGGIPGADWLVDHVHPSVKGHQLIADALLDDLASRGLVERLPGWEKRRDARYREHLSSLDPLYFSKGLQILSAVQHWARGRVSNELPFRQPDPAPGGEEPLPEDGSGSGKR
ncbi:MAG: GDSL-type esterase/lipase family protein [Planctomycetota bacterium]|nr:GDSL-type esterase/lipase family protein [Planctomycetota bacterium]